ncbi:hypothetical protein [Geotalea sp. SG265]|uniref:hypothetical protein n=1 Tax=Geotalea sp. SG265 TaxID=2922867 RepID=UPI001FAE8731|nr:hypothetical protein [Geotalea sp. SG265]
MKRPSIPVAGTKGRPSVPACLVFLAVAAALGLTGCAESKSSPPEGKAFAAVTTAKQAPQAAAPAAAAFAKATTADKPAAKQAAKAATKAYTSAAAKEPKGKYLAGEDPAYAKRCGWPVKCPEPLPGSILPKKRIVAYYGNPLSKRMGALGEYQKDEMLRRLKGEAARWEKADPSHPVQPALHLIAVVAQGDPGKAGKYRMVMPDKIVNQVYGWAKEANALLFIDIQTGHDNIRTLLPRFEWILKNPDVHLGIDPEFNLIKCGKVPGSKIGTYDAEDINYASGFLRDLVKKYNIPPKVFTVHRFTRNGVTNARRIAVRPEVQMIMHMDGWGAPWLKRDSYKDYIVSEPVQYTGFKLFYHNDTKKGDPLMTPQDLLKLEPKPLYVQYQ